MIDLAQFFTSPAALYTLAIIPVVEVLKDWGLVQWLAARWGKTRVLRGLSVVVGLFLAAAAKGFGFIEMTVVEALVFGLSAGLGNTGLVAFLKGLKPSLPESAGVALVADDSRVVDFGGFTEDVVDVWVSEAGRYALGFLSGLPLVGTLTGAMSVIEPILRGYAAVALTEDDKSQIKLKVMKELRQWGLLKSTGQGVNTSLLVLLLLTFVLSGCAVLQGGVATVTNVFTADGARLEYVEGAECYALFSSGESLSLDTKALVEGVSPLDSRDNCRALGEDGYVCELGSVQDHKLEYECGVVGSIIYEGVREDGSSILVLPN